MRARNACDRMGCWRDASDSPELRVGALQLHLGHNHMGCPGRRHADGPALSRAEVECQSAGRITESGGKERRECGWLGWGGGGGEPGLAEGSGGGSELVSHAAGQPRCSRWHRPCRAMERAGPWLPSPVFAPRPRHSHALCFSPDSHPGELWDAPITGRSIVPVVSRGSPTQASGSQAPSTAPVFPTLPPAVLLP